MIEISRFYHPAHYAFAQHLLASHNMSQSFLYDLPETGFIAFENGNIIAMGFLRLIEGGYGMLDALITEPTQSKELRNEALDLIAKALIDRAKEITLKNTFAFIKDHNTIQRAQKHGFVASKYKLFGLAISGENHLCHS